MNGLLHIQLNIQHPDYEAKTIFSQKSKSLPSSLCFGGAFRATCCRIWSCVCWFCKKGERNFLRGGCCGVFVHGVLKMFGINYWPQ